MKTQVGIIGAGPAGLLLSHVLDQQGIDTILLENRSQSYVENRVRAGVLEQGTVNFLDEVGLSERMHREGMPHHGFEIRFGEQSLHINFDDLTDGKGITVYGQQEIVKDMIAARMAADAKLYFDVTNVSIKDPQGNNPTISFDHDANSHELRCDFVIGCDGFHGISRETIPEQEKETYDRNYPFAWLGILVEAPPSSKELIYANSPDGFALHSMRSPNITRNYVQCPPNDKIEDWSNDRIWSELHKRLETREGWTLTEGKIIEKSITPMRSFVCETMRFGNLFLAGDAAHIVPPTGAKGMNLAISDIRYLSAALTQWYQTNSEALLVSYAEQCLRRVWRGQHFSWYMTSLLHKFPEDAGFQQRLQLAEFNNLSKSRESRTALAENYVGIEF